MTKPETKINTRVRKAFDAIPGIDAHRMELKTGEPGWPDWQFFMSCGIVGFVESKWVYDESDPLKDWRKEQRAWAKRKISFGYPTLVIVGNDKNTWVYSAKSIIEGGVVPSIKFGTTINSEWLKNTIVVEYGIAGLSRRTVY